MTLRGSQVPQLLVEPPSVFAPADVATTWAAAFGLRLDPWQSRCLRLILGEDSSGRWAASDAGIWVPRQNGKGSVIEAIVLWHQLVLGTPSIIWSAHNYDIAAKAFRRYERLLLANAAVHDELIVKINRGIGRQSVTANLGDRESTVTWNTRSKSGLRGTDAVGLLVLDEAQELTDDQMNTVTPTLAARSMETPGPQTVYLGTPPTDRTSWAYQLRDMGREGAPRTAWADWGVQVPDDERDADGRVADAVLDDRSLWAASNPALGVRISLDFLSGQRRKLGHGFGQEHLGIWQPPILGAGSPISPEVWAATRRVLPTERSRPMALALDARGERWHVAVAWRVGEGDRVAVQVVADGSDVQAGADHLRDLAGRNHPDAVLVDSHGAVAGVIPDLLQIHNLQVLTPGKSADAWTRWVGDVVGGRVWSSDDPSQEVLAGAVASAVERRVGDRMALDRARSGPDVSAVGAAMYAAWGAVSAPVHEPVLIRT